MKLSHLSSAAALCLQTVLCQTVTITEAPSIPSNEPSFTSHSQFTSAVLNSTNSYRAEHNASAVSWNTTLQSFAASYLAKADCDFAHSGGPYGENLAEGYLNVTASVEGWGNEVSEYDFGNPGFSEQTGHFTQLVWKDTTDVGCAAALCGSRGWYLVCEYWPRGNVDGEFQEEVQQGDGGSSSSSGGGRRTGPGWGALSLLGVVWVIKLLATGALLVSRDVD